MGSREPVTTGKYMYKGSGQPFFLKNKIRAVNVSLLFGVALPLCTVADGMVR